jgi:hypothetical protein
MAAKTRTALIVLVAAFLHEVKCLGSLCLPAVACQGICWSFYSELSGPCLMYRSGLCQQSFPLLHVLPPVTVGLQPLRGGFGCNACCSERLPFPWSAAIPAQHPPTTCPAVHLCICPVVHMLPCCTCFGCGVHKQAWVLDSRCSVLCAASDAASHAVCDCVDNLGMQQCAALALPCPAYRCVMLGWWLGWPHGP